jgi:hypothetical protein
MCTVDSCLKLLLLLRFMPQVHSKSQLSSTTAQHTASVVKEVPFTIKGIQARAKVCVGINAFSFERLTWLLS